MQNVDELYLLSKKIILSDDAFPVLAQGLRIAIYDKYRLCEFYKKTIDIYGASDPFLALLHVHVKHYEELKELAKSHEVQIPKNDASVKVPKNLQEVYELAIAYEIEHIYMYDDLICYISKHEDVLDAFYRFQASSYNEHLPTLRLHVKNANANPQELMQKFNELGEIVQKVASGEVDPNELTSMLGKTNLSLIGGLLVGGVGGLALNEILQENEKNEGE